MNLRLMFTAAMIVLLAGPWSPLRAQAFEDLERIRATVERHLIDRHGASGNTHVTVSALDPRLRLARCAQAPVAFTPSGGRALGNASVGVRCGGAHPWTLYVPARVARIEAVLVTTRPLDGGTVLTAGDLRAEPRETNGLAAGYLTRPEQAVGKHLRHTLAAGSVIAPSQLNGPRLVRRGAPVTVVAQGAGIEVRSQAEALSDGSPGDSISVRNVLTRKVIEGTVTASGLVQVGP